MAEELTHVDQTGRARMVDVGQKDPMRRRAVARGYFRADPGTIDRVLDDRLDKGDAIAVARIAGIQAAKRCSDLIPLCHPLGLDVVDVDVDRESPGRLRITASAAVVARTGVEMEALTAVSVAALTLWDMTKSIDANLQIEQVELVEKTKEHVER